MNAIVELQWVIYGVLGGKDGCMSGRPIGVLSVESE
jgi:hypothetical protein